VIVGVISMTKILLRLAAVLAVGVSAAGCSSVPDWIDPTSWVGDNSAQTADDSGQEPDLADIPSKPHASTPDDQKQVADSLAADRSQATYSADALRAGNETSVPPPADAPPPDRSAAHANTEEDAQAAPSTPASSTATDTVSSTMEVSAPPPTRVASVETPRAQSQRSPATMVSTSPAPSAASQSDTSLGFRPSSAPALDPSVAQFVSPSVLSRYRQTASLSPDSAVAPPSATETKSSGRHKRHKSAEGEGGPEQMSGDVVANMDAVDGPGASLWAYADANGNAPAAVVFFPGDGTTLNASSRAKVKQVVQAYQAKGNQGFIKVVGHSSSRTPNMPMEKHLALIFQRSQDRANAVAHEIIREGVPADKVLVDAVGDSQPVYYESMPKGEEGNRRAEIFLQS